MTLAKDLRSGDRLEPDGTQVMSTKYEGRYIEVILKQPGKAMTTYHLDPNWPLIVKRARALLREQRQAPNKRPFNYAGDGTVKVYKANQSKPKRIITQSMLSELLTDED